MRKLVTYFSAEGNTKKIGDELAQLLEADSFEIIPQELYTASDIKWVNPLARCNKEQLGKKDVPIAGKVENWDEYDTIYIGFPIWYGMAPRIIYTFCEQYNWNGKKIHLFATSISSKIGKTAEKLKPVVEGAEIVYAQVVKSANEVG
ncbi:MAG: flavodoxin [Lachnospiraceae bacterium]|nr:flavodoxin [Lachnospiraceae bacterium]